MLAHWDEVEWSRTDRGPLQGERQRLGAAAGCARAGLSRYRMGPHERVMPVHVHADEEEIFYVLGGSGVSWQGGRTYPVSTGDCIVYPAGGEPHTVIADEGGLDVLAFGSGSDTGMTWLPRAGGWWMGPRWLPSDGPSPFRLEAEAGELELPDAGGRAAADDRGHAGGRAEADAPRVGLQRAARPGERGRIRA